MLMSIPEATGRNCPLFYASMLGYAVQERFGNVSCRASDCPMWRWDDPDIPFRGYCGLAGRPEKLAGGGCCNDRS